MTLYPLVLSLSKGEMARQSWFEGLMSRLFKVAEGDNRDWNKIRQWAESLPPTLQG